MYSENICKNVALVSFQSKALETKEKVASCKEIRLVANGLYIASDLNSRIDDVENEMKSLIVTIKLIQVEWNTRDNDIHDAV